MRYLTLSRVQEFIAVPNNMPPELACELAKAEMRLALRASYNADDSRKSLRLRISPTKGVIVKVATKAKGIKLVPLTSAISVYSNKDHPMGVPRVEGAMMHNGKTYNIAIGTPKIIVESPKLIQGASTSAAREFFAPAYWLVQSTKDAARANMEMITTKVSITVGDVTKKVIVPMLVNSASVKENDGLFVYRPMEAKAPPAAAGTKRGAEGALAKGGACKQQRS